MRILSISAPPMAKKAAIIGGRKALAAAEPQIRKAVEGSGIEIIGTFWYGGEASRENMDMLRPQVADADMIFAVGGGKAIDTCKVLAHETNRPFFTFPTIASTCASCTSLGIVYHPDGSLREYSFSKIPPNHIFINTEIIANAPARYLWAGMGDTMAKHYECTISSDAHIIPDAGGRRARAAPEAVDGNDVRARARNARGDGRHIVYGGYFHNDGLFIMGGFLQAVDELAQVLDGIDVVVRRGADGVRSLGHHARAGHIAHDLRAGQMPADARLCPLPHLDLHSRACVQVFAVYAEPAGRHLHDGVGAVTVKILMQAALAGVVAHTQLRSRPRQRFMGIVADGPIAHGAEHDRHGQLDMRRFFGTMAPFSSRRISISFCPGKPASPWVRAAGRWAGSSPGRH